MNDISKRTSKRKWPKVAAAITALSIASLTPTAVFADAATEKWMLMQAAGEIPMSPSTEVKPEAKITGDDAVAAVRKLFPQFENYTVTSVNLGDTGSYPPRYQNVWTIQWELRDGNGSYGFSSMVDSMTGEILQASMPYEDKFGEPTYYPAKVSQEEALDLAKAFIRKAAPSLDPASVHYNEGLPYLYPQALFGPVNYQFSFNLDVNGVRSQSESIYITMNGSGDITAYQRSNQSAAYPSSTPAIRAEDAEAAFRSALEMTLQYVPSYSSYGMEKKWTLAWTPAPASSYVVDAQTGDFLDGQGNKVPGVPLGFDAIEKQDNVFVPANPGKDGLSGEEAAKLVEDTLQLPAEKKRSGQYSRTDGGYANKGQKLWDLSWMEEANAPQGYPNSSRATVDAATGQLLQFHLNSYGPPWMQPEQKGEKISREEARAIALDLVQRLYPNASEELKLQAFDPSRADEPNFSFYFQRMHAGILVSGDSVNVTLDGQGKLVDYYVNRTIGLEEQLKGLAAKTTKEEASALYRKEMKAQLEYVMYGGYYTPSGKPEPVSVKLVYRFVTADPDKQAMAIDASTGQWKRIGWLLPEQRGKQGPAPAEITSHRAAEALGVLWRYQVIQPDSTGKVKTDEALTVGSWMTMMARAVNPGYEQMLPYFSSGNPAAQEEASKKPYAAELELFKQFNWLTAKEAAAIDPEATLTRERLADSLVHILHYSKLAGTIKSSALEALKDKVDLDPAYAGEVALALQLELLKPATDQRFEPKKAVTLAEAAEAMLRLLALQGKVDQLISR
ncbi:peptidase M4 [Paenibacillus sp. J31TS4]|uniref:YcdB/YcdC domain-containing protein n=1 Tax=Paenibacillus sp. J31TS4 TaxID=2807195 RepID=UPI001B1C6303|nr:YcdB/YcdC domain-containing protein [Paenibacillus sp. J31TS4]GIP37020.1 peptidase M4 [Paenibacillus sp. J31TS4]